MVQVAPAARASRLPSLLATLRGDVAGADWSYVSPNIVFFYLGLSDRRRTEIDGLLPAIRNMANIKGVSGRFGWPRYAGSLGS